MAVVAMHLRGLGSVLVMESFPRTPVPVVYGVYLIPASGSVEKRLSEAGWHLEGDWNAQPWGGSARVRRFVVADPHTINQEPAPRRAAGRAVAALPQAYQDLGQAWAAYQLEAGSADLLISTRIHTLRRFLSSIEPLALQDCTREDVEAFLLGVTGRSSRIARATALRLMFRWMAATGRLVPPPEVPSAAELKGTRS